MCENAGNVAGYKKHLARAGIDVNTGNTMWGSGHVTHDSTGGPATTTAKGKKVQETKSVPVTSARMNTRSSRKKTASAVVVKDDTLSDSNADSTIMEIPVFPGWNAVLNQMSECDTFDELRLVVLQYKDFMPAFVPRHEVINFRMCVDREDRLAADLIPAECKKAGYFFPILTSGDGSCFPHTLSRFAYGHEAQADEMRVRMVVEGVMNSVLYLSEEHLLRGSFMYEESAQECFTEDLVEIYAKRSGFAIPMADYSIAENKLAVFQEELFQTAKKSATCGVWSLHIAANIFARPVLSWFPDVHEGFAGERHEVHRQIYPEHEGDWQYKPLIIMWTKSHAEATSYNHFVPVVK